MKNPVKDKINQTKQASRLDRIYGWLLTVGGGIGLLSAFVLTVEKIELIKNPNYIPTCNVSPILSCGSIMKTPQAELFGFPNPLLGLIGFTVVITIGVAILSGIKFKDWYMKGLLLVSGLAVIFIHWLIYQSLYTIGALCPYCMVVWSVTIPIFWYTLLYAFRHKILTTPDKLKNIVRFAERHNLDILLSWYLIIILLILNRFWYYWTSLI